MIPLARTPWSEDGADAMAEAQQAMDKHLKRSFLPWEEKHPQTKEERMEEFDRRRRERFKQKYGVEEGIVFVDTGDRVAEGLADEDVKVVRRKKNG